MAEALIKLGERLSGDSLIIYILCLGLLGVIFYLLRLLKHVAQELHENSNHLAAISEQLRSLVQAAITGRKNVR